jgi:hypothetical protein
MTTRNWAAILPVVMLVLALAAGLASAEDIVVPANSSYSEQVHADEGDSISITWDSFNDVRLVVSDPVGTEIEDITDDSWTVLLDADRTGQYTIIWYNSMSTAQTVDRNIEVIPISVEGLFDSIAMFVLIIALGIIGFIVIIVLIVVFVLKKDKAPAQQPAYQGTYGPPPPGPMPPVSSVPGTCPMCKAAVTPEMVFCEKCGARLR